MSDINVIVPVFNGESFLKNCIESILKQSLQPSRIIIIDDGSTDGTADICKRLEQQYQSITVLSLNDEGVSAARNAGLREATGEYIAFVDADDRLLPDALERLYTAMEETGSDIAGCGFVTFGKEEDWQTLCAGNRDNKKEIYSTRTGREFWQQGIYGGDTRCWSKLYKRSVIGDVMFREGLSIGEDMLFLADLLPNVRKMVTTSYQGYGYYQNPKGAMLRKFTPSYMDQITCWEIAREKAVREVPDLKDKAGSILMISIMLTAGKISMLSGSERKQVKEYIRICTEKLKTEMMNKKAFLLLDRGYRIKAALFRAVPSVYLSFYHWIKYKAG